MLKILFSEKMKTSPMVKVFLPRICADCIMDSFRQMSRSSGVHPASGVTVLECPHQGDNWDFGHSLTDLPTRQHSAVTLPAPYRGMTCHLVSLSLFENVVIWAVALTHS